MEYSEVEGNGCSIGPNPVPDVTKASAGKTVALFALPGAFTPTCSAKHVPGYLCRSLTSSRPLASTRSGASASMTRS
jgi:peroxiredoxin